MKKILFLSVLSASLFLQCGKSTKTDSFLITEDAVGGLVYGAKIKHLDSIFATDSIVKIQSSPNVIETQGEVEIFEKGGKKLLLLSPKAEMDPNSTVSDILFYDSRYHTESGLSKESSFTEFAQEHEVKEIFQTLNNVVVFFKNSNLYLTLDVKYLMPEVRGNLSAKLTANHIQDDAPIKYLRLDWGK